MSNIFRKWNNGELNSFLVEITAEILKKEDSLKDGFLLDHILDSAKQKGTGKWTSQIAMDYQAPVPTIDVAVTMRHLSTFKTERIKANELFNGATTLIEDDKNTFIHKLENALYLSILITYAQGFELLRIASEEKGFELNPGDVAKIWRGGCIIRSDMLDSFMNAFESNPGLSNILFDKNISNDVNKKQNHLRDVIIQATKAGLPIPGLMASLAYFDAYRRSLLPTNMIQAQRDYFGSHTYERIGEEGIFHTDW